MMGTKLRTAQEQWLLKTLQRNTGCSYAQTYGFDGIDSIERYQERVPLVTYDQLSPWIERIQNGERDLLFHGRAFAFEITGGSTGGAKVIPYTRESLRDFHAAIYPWFEKTVAAYDLMGATAYWSISPALRLPERTQCGTPIGVSDAAYLGDEIAKAMAAHMAVPLWVGSLQEIKAWRIATLYGLIRAVDLAWISVWSPTFFLMLLEVLQKYASDLIHVLQYGAQIEGHTVEPDRVALQRLRHYLQSGDTALLWPQLKLISCWQDAMSEPYAQKLKQHFPMVSFEPKGLISTEGVVTIPNHEGMPLLSAQSGFYEFIDAQGAVRLPDSLEYQQVYEVVMTTSGGLYRYRTHDMVRYEGMQHALPILRFCGRKGAVCDLVGEKLSEAFVQQILKKIGTEVMLVAVASKKPHYRLVGRVQAPDKVLKQVESALLQNPQYAYARRIGQLGALEMLAVDHMLQRYMEYKRACGSRIGDIKVPILCTDQAWLEHLQKVQR
jgi:hypothetical protein